jgi:hypothetical protein
MRLTPERLRPGWQPETPWLETLYRGLEHRRWAPD